MGDIDKESFRAAAEALGFVKVGFARAERLSEEEERLRRWLAAGRHGEMFYMERALEERLDPRRPGIVKGACSVVVLVTPYARGDHAIDLDPGRVARYAWGRDYHNLLYKRCRALTRILREQGHEARAAVDTLPVWERAWAQRAGVGFIGKNCCLIVPGWGSHVLLSAIVTTATFEPDEAMEERCGSCRLCLDACPTGAFVDAYELEARRCIAYWTIEASSPPPRELRPGFGDWVFGCDRCQEVCPYNRGAAQRRPSEAAFAPHPRWEGKDAEALLQMDEAEFADFAAGSPLKRTGLSGMRRNLAIALGNAGARRHLPVLRQWLAAPIQGEDDSSTREVIAWAVERIEARESESCPGAEPQLARGEER